MHCGCEIISRTESNVTSLKGNISIGSSNESADGLAGGLGSVTGGLNFGLVNSGPGGFGLGHRQGA